MNHAAAGEIVRDGQAVESGCIPLEWVGHTAPSLDPRVSAGLRNGSLSDDQMHRLESMQAHATYRIVGKTSRVLGPDGRAGITGMTMRYRWGPDAGTFVVAVRFRDADIILSLAGREFVDRSAPVIIPARPQVQETIISREKYRTIDEYQRAVGR